MIRHGFIYMISRLSTGIIGFISIIIYTRMMLPEEYGNYAIALVYVNILSTFMYQWFRLGLIRYIPKYSDSKVMYSKLLNTAALCFLICSVISFFIGLGIYLLFQQSITIIVGILLYLWTTTWFELSQAIQRSNLKPIRFGLMTSIKSLLGLFFGILALKLGYEEVGLLIGISIGTLITNILFYKDWIGLRLSIDRQFLMQLFKYGFPLIISGGMTYLMQSIDRVMISQMLGNEQAGIYAVTFDFALQTIGMLMLIVNLSALPLVIRKLENEGYESAQQQLLKNYELLIAISFPAVVGIIILNSNLTGVVFDSNYQELSRVILPIVSVAMLLQGIKSYYTDLSYQLGKTTYRQAIPVGVGILLNITMNLFLIPTYGVMGAAYSSLVSYFISLILNWFLANKIFKLPFSVLESLKIILATAVMSMALLVLNNNSGILFLIIQIFVGILVYSFMCLILNVMGIGKELTDKFLLRKKIKHVIQKLKI